VERNPFVVLGVLVALLLGLLVIFAIPASVPLAAEETESSLHLPEESRPSPPSAGEEEFSSVLDWILSHPRGQELLEGLSQEIIDRLAVEPMPPPAEPQPVVLEEEPLEQWYTKLTYEEARRHAEGVPPDRRLVIEIPGETIIIPFIFGLDPPPPRGEPSTILDWILTYPKSEEALELLPQEIIDELSTTPVPPYGEPWELVVAQGDSTVRVFVLDEE
jgi:hypothetical protein